jgi:glutathione synthase/RimK-type ligase-like ATP-grasp enzyme
MISVLIPDCDEWLSLPVAYCLKVSRQIVVHGLSRRRSRPLRLSRLFASFEDIKEYELPSWLTRIDEIVAREGVDVVMPASSAGIRALSVHRQRLSCAEKLVWLPEAHAFDVATNKARLADLLADTDLPRPRTAVVPGVSPKPEILSALTFPVLAKPPLSSGGAGIRRFEHLRELNQFLSDRSDLQDWIIQEYVQGTDLCVNLLCQNGRILASTVQHAITPPSAPYASIGAGFHFTDDALAIDIARRLVEKLGWSGVANIDMRLDAKRALPLVLEVNGRYWNSLLGSLHAGVNFPLLACEALLGRSLSNRRPAHVRYFNGAANAVLSLVGGGQNRIRPGETDLTYLSRDLSFFISIQFAKAAKYVRERLPTIMRRATRP